MFSCLVSGPPGHHSECQHCNLSRVTMSVWKLKWPSWYYTGCYLPPNFSGKLQGHDAEIPLWNLGLVIIHKMNLDSKQVSKLSSWHSRCGKTTTLSLPHTSTVSFTNTRPQTKLVLQSEKGVGMAGKWHSTLSCAVSGAPWNGYHDSLACLSFHCRTPKSQNEVRFILSKKVIFKNMFWTNLFFHIFG